MLLSDLSKLKSPPKKRVQIPRETPSEREAILEDDPTHLENTIQSGSPNDSDPIPSLIRPKAVKVITPPISFLNLKSPPLQLHLKHKTPRTSVTRSEKRILDGILDQHSGDPNAIPSERIFEEKEPLNDTPISLPWILPFGSTLDATLPGKLGPWNITEGMHTLSELNRPAPQEEGHSVLRAFNACIECRSRHATCGTERPCARCKIKGIECVEAPSKKVDARAKKEREMIEKGIVKQTKMTSLPKVNASISTPTIASNLTEWSNESSNESNDAMTHLGYSQPIYSPIQKESTDPQISFIKSVESNDESVELSNGSIELPETAKGKVQSRLGSGRTGRLPHIHPTSVKPVGYRGVKLSKVSYVPKVSFDLPPSLFVKPKNLPKENITATSRESNRESNLGNFKLSKVSKVSSVTPLGSVSTTNVSTNGQPEMLLSWSKRPSKQKIHDTPPGDLPKDVKDEKVDVISQKSKDSSATQKQILLKLPKILPRIVQDITK